MALKLKVAKLDEVEEQFRALYKMAGDGNFYLDAEEDEDHKTKLKEFRDNNVKLMKEKEELEKRLKDIGDPDEISKMKKRIQDIDDKQMIEAGKLDELVNQKVERMKADFESQLNAMKLALENKDKDLYNLNTRLSEVLIDSEITKAVTAIGSVRKDAMQDVISRGKRVWSLEDGKPTPKEGDKVLYGKDGKSILTFDEWAEILFQTAPFLFDPSSGSGAAGGSRDAAANRTQSEREALAKLPPQERLKMIHERK